MKIENIESILNKWEVDSEIDKTDIQGELLKIPKLHSKYLRLLMDSRSMSILYKNKYHEMRKKKWIYYSGRMSKEELLAEGWEQFQDKILKTDIYQYMDSDPDLIHVLNRKEEYDLMVSAIESIMSELKSRTFQLRDFITFEKFIQGAG